MTQDSLKKHGASSANTDHTAALDFQKLLGVVRTLRNTNGCPWDREQTHASLRAYLLEECYELLDSVSTEDVEGVREELGDLLVHIVFFADIAERSDDFDKSSMINAATKKLIDRHPHVFGNTGRLESVEAVTKRWDDLKRKQKGRALSMVGGMSASMPALAYTAGLQNRATRAGVPWTKNLPETILSDETINSLKQLNRGRKQETVAGELLFRVVAELAQLGIDPEMALRTTTLIFKNHLMRMESYAGNKSLSNLTPDEKERIWEAASK